MSIFDRVFKLKNEEIYKMQKENAINVLRSATHNKMNYKETERIYDILSSKAMTLNSTNERIKEAYSLIDSLKDDWLTKDEKKAFVAGVWLCECATDSKNNKGITYINPQELDYTKNAVLGTIFKSIDTKTTLL